MPLVFTRLGLTGCLAESKCLDPESLLVALKQLDRDHRHSQVPQSPSEDSGVCPDDFAFVTSEKVEGIVEANAVGKVEQRAAPSS